MAKSVKRKVNELRVRVRRRRLDRESKSVKRLQLQRNKALREANVAMLKAKARQQKITAEERRKKARGDVSLAKKADKLIGSLNRGLDYITGTKPKKRRKAVRRRKVRKS